MPHQVIARQVSDRRTPDNAHFGQVHAVAQTFCDTESFFIHLACELHANSSLTRVIRFMYGGMLSVPARYWRSVWSYARSKKLASYLDDD